MSQHEPPAIQGSILEGLFVKGPANDPALQERLVSHGFDAQHLAPSYPPVVFQNCISEAARFYWPDLPQAEAQRRLGGMTVEGFRGTVLGSITLAALKLLGPERLIKQIPKRIFSGQNYGHSEVRELSPRRWEVDYFGIPEGVVYSSEFVCGAIETALVLSGAREVSVSEVRRGEGGFVMEVRWDAESPG